MAVDIEKLYTWRKYREGDCDNCMAYCCKLPVEVTVEDLVKMEVICDFTAGEPIKNIAKQLKKEGVVQRFNLKREIFTLAQYENGDCLFLDQETRKCTIYDKRPTTCMNHPQVGPRPGFCAYIKKED